MLQERLGHPDIQTTFNTYGGLFHGYDEGIACALDDAFIASIWALRVPDPCHFPYRHGTKRVLRQRKPLLVGDPVDGLQSHRFHPPWTRRPRVVASVLLIQPEAELDEQVLGPGRHMLVGVRVPSPAPHSHRGFRNTRPHASRNERTVDSALGFARIWSLYWVEDQSGQVATPRGFRTSPVVG